LQGSLGIVKKIWKEQKVEEEGGVEDKELDWIEDFI
tara:strand:- start:1750 stop:1857 length:108 start_codon:yes stop_codon:yes gene_type:complete